MSDAARKTSDIRNFLKLADTAAHAAFVACIKDAFPRPKDERRVREYLRNPAFRPLFEIRYNGATSYAGALILKALEYIETELYLVHFGPLKGHIIQAVRLTQEGREALDQFSPMAEVEPVFDAIETAIAGYVAIDTGAGLVAQRRLIDFAVQYQDSDILTRLMDLDSGQAQYLHLPDDDPLSDEDRRDHVEFWCGAGDRRSGADFIDLDLVNP